MADRLNGYRILILETREEAHFSKLLAEQGADVLQCPMFTINDPPDPAPVAAWIRGVPYITLVRMAANLGIGVLVGSIPLFGDIFDIFWKANRRNYRLLCRHLDEPRRHTASDWAFLLMVVAALLVVFAIPVALAVWLIAWLAGHM